MDEKREKYKEECSNVWIFMQTNLKSSAAAAAAAQQMSIGKENVLQKFKQNKQYAVCCFFFNLKFSIFFYPMFFSLFVFIFRILIHAMVILFGWRRKKKLLCTKQITTTHCCSYTDKDTHTECIYSYKHSGTMCVYVYFIIGSEN